MRNLFMLLLCGMVFLGAAHHFPAHQEAFLNAATACIGIAALFSLIRGAF